MTTVEYLRAAKALIQNPDNWCKGAMRKPKADGTCRFCAAGAVNEVCPVGVGGWRITENLQVFKVLTDVVRGLPREQSLSAPHFNDSHTHAEVMALFDKAIEQAQR